METLRMTQAHNKHSALLAIIVNCPRLWGPVIAEPPELTECVRCIGNPMCIIHSFICSTHISGVPAVCQALG